LPNEPRWLEPADICALNALIVAETGEPYLVRDEGLLESACQRPYNRYAYDGVEDVVTLAVELLFGIARNHPFAQGNKRTGFEAAILFLQANGYDLVIEDSQALGRSVVDVITGAMAPEAFEALIRPHVTPA
jgi:death-on-curing protein